MKNRLIKLGLASLAALCITACGTANEDVVEDTETEVEAQGLAVNPSSEVTFNAVSQYSSDTQFVIISNDGERTLELQSVQVVGPSNVFAVTVPDQTTLAPGDSTAVSVSYTPDSTGLVNGELLIRSSGGDATLELAPYATTGAVFVAPDPVAFGRVSAGMTATLEMVVQNIGDGPLTVDDVQVVPAGSFGLVDVFEPTVLQPTEYIELEVAFTSDGDAVDTAAIVVTSDDVNTPQLEVPITANDTGP